MTRAEIIAEARKWSGVLYRRRGRSMSGIDCIGLPVMIARAFNVPHEDYPDYDDWPDPTRRILRECRKNLTFVPRPLARLPGLVGVFAETKFPGHMGIFSDIAGQTHVIHARIDRRRVVEQLYRPQDPELRLVALFAFPGMED